MIDHINDKKVMVFGAGGRVGQALVSRLLISGIRVVAVDILNSTALQAMMQRLFLDASLVSSSVTSPMCYGDTDILNLNQITELLLSEQPDAVVNYAIPFTWDATKSRANYAQLSAAGLGAFSAIQVLAPLHIAQAIQQAQLSPKFLVGNLPDITIPYLYALANQESLYKPNCGAGNVGLIELAVRYQLCHKLNLPTADIQVSLVAHHIHWVAPREPGYSNQAPFMCKIHCRGTDISEQCGDLRELLNTAITSCYEAGAGFSSTTGLLAAQNLMALLSDSDSVQRLHCPAPNGLAGGYPVMIKHGQLLLDLPADCQLNEMQLAMEEAQRLDGVEQIHPNGSLEFSQKAVDIIGRETGFDLPKKVVRNDLVEVALAQVQAMKN